MVTHFATSAQQFNNRTVENTVDIPGTVVAGSSVMFVCDTSAVQGNPSSSFIIEFLNAAQAVVSRLASTVAVIGRADIGATLPPSATRVHIQMDVSGRMTMAFRVVSFAPGEDVPESF